jgi:hypothetical protein
MSNRLPAPIDRDTFQRVLQRAAELQAQGRDIGEGLSEAEVLALGEEVGISESHLRQALLEERTRHAPPEPEGILDRWVASDEVIAERVVQGSEASIQASLIAWLERNELLVVQRATLGRVSFERISSFAGAMRRIGISFHARGTRPFLDKVELLTAVITPLEAGFCHVSLAASLKEARSSYVGGGAALASLGVASGAVVVALGAPMLLLGATVLMGSGIGWRVTMMFRPIRDRARLGLERALDQLEQQPSLSGGNTQSPKGRGIARDVGQVVREFTREVRKAIED